jgi:hypothetical protein
VNTRQLLFRGRYILEGVVVLHEVVHEIKIKNWRG